MSPENDQVRLGFIGCGSHSTANLYPCLRWAKEIDFIATCDLKEELAKRNARMFGAERWYTDYQKMLREESLDAVMICGPPQMHSELGISCLEQGVHVFVEKPPAISAAEAKELLHVSRRTGKHVMVAFMKRFATGYRMAKQITENHEFGRPVQIETKFANGPYGALWGLESPVKSFLIGQIVHHFDLVRYYMGDAEEVYARKAEIAENKYAISVLIKFRSSSLGLMNNNSCESWMRQNERVEIAGDEHFVVVDNVCRLLYYPKRNWIEPSGYQVYNLATFWEPNSTVPAQANHSHYLMGYFGEIEHFAKSLVAGSAPKPDIEDGLKALQLAEAVWKSVNTDEKVKVEDLA